MAVKTEHDAPTHRQQAHDGACPGCGVMLPRSDGPRHAYLGASAACLELFGRLGSPASAQPDAARVRRLLHSAYAAQHPGEPQLRSVQSVAVHLMSLCSLLERDGDAAARPVPVLGRLPPRRPLDLHWLEPPEVRGTLTIVDGCGAVAPGGRAALAELWARDVWAAWEPHHATVRRWLDRARPRRAGG